MANNDTMLERKTLAILEILQEAGEPLGARAISRELALRGVDLNERTVRYHLMHMDERGFTRLEGRSGRVLTQRGQDEVESALAVDRVGFVNSRIDGLACQVLAGRTTGGIDRGGGRGSACAVKGNVKRIARHCHGYIIDTIPISANRVVIIEVEFDLEVGREIHATTHSSCL